MGFFATRLLSSVARLSLVLLLFFLAPSCKDDDVPDRRVDPRQLAGLGREAELQSRQARHDRLDFLLAQSLLLRGRRGLDTPHSGSVPLCPARRGRSGACSTERRRGARGPWSPTGPSSPPRTASSPTTLGRPARRPSPIHADQPVAGEVRGRQGLENPDYTFEVKEIHVHPAVPNSFDHLENDLAVLVLRSPRHEAAGIVPIPVNLETIEKTGGGRRPSRSGGFGSLTCGTYDFSPVRYFAKLAISNVLERDIGVRP